MAIVNRDNSFSIRPATPDDAIAVARIYNHFILHTVVTFEMEEVSAEEMRDRIEAVQSLSFPWLIGESHKEVVGYAYANRWHHRAAYRKSSETTVYVDPDHGGKGFGTRLYEQLLKEVADVGIHTVIGGIALPNDASVSLHEKLGFEKAAHYREVGFKSGRWIDVGYWQKLL